MKLTETTLYQLQFILLQVTAEAKKLKLKRKEKRKNYLFICQKREVCLT